MNNDGTIVGVRGNIAEVLISDPVPKRHDVLITHSKKPAYLEVMASATAHSIFCLILSEGSGLTRGQAVHNTNTPLMIPVGQACLGRAFDIFATPHDTGGPLHQDPRRSLFVKPERDFQNITTPSQVIETGIKAIDFFTPLLQGGKAAFIGGAGVGKTVILTELARRLVIKPNKQTKARPGVAVFAAVGERSREAQELLDALQESKVLPKTTLLIGQMGENPAVRFRTAYAGATIAEYFRDEEETDVLYYMDNLYRFTQAGLELATMANTIPSEDGYQATLTSEVATLNERLHSTRKAAITSFMAMFVPSDDFTDSGVQASLPFLDTTIVLSREIFQSGRWPAIDFLSSTSAALSANVAGMQHYLAHIEAQRILERTAQLERIVSLVGEDELSTDNQKIYHRAELITSYMTQDLYLSEAETGHPSVTVPVKQTVKTVSEIIAGKFDHVSPDRLRYAREEDVRGARLEVKKPKKAATVSPAANVTVSGGEGQKAT